MSLSLPPTVPFRTPPLRRPYVMYNHQNFRVGSRPPVAVMSVILRPPKCGLLSSRCTPFSPRQVFYFTIRHLPGSLPPFFLLKELPCVLWIFVTVSQLFRFIVRWALFMPASFGPSGRAATSLRTPLHTNPWPISRFSGPSSFFLRLMLSQGSAAW